MRILALLVLFLLVVASVSGAIFSASETCISGQNITESMLTMIQAWRANEAVYITLTGDDGKDYEIVPWFSANDQCPFVQQSPGNCFSTGTCDLHNCISGVGTLSNTNFCMVTDEMSQVSYSETLWSQNNTRMGNWINTFELTNCGRPGFRREWVTHMSISGGQLVTSSGTVCNQVGDDASDTTAHEILSLAAINTSSYANISNQEKAGDYLDTMCQGFIEDNFVVADLRSDFVGGVVSDWHVPCGGTNVCGGLGNNELIYTGYHGAHMEALAACDAKLGSNSTHNYSKAADGVAYTFYLGSDWDGPGDSFSIGMAYKWHMSNFGQTSVEPTVVCDVDCSVGPRNIPAVVWPDSIRVTRFCTGAYAWDAFRGHEIPGAQDYCNQWESQPGQTGTAHVIERWQDGVAKSGSDSGYRATGLGCFLNSYAQTSRMLTRTQQFCSHFGSGVMDGQDCFGVYDKAFGIMCAAYGAGAADRIYTRNGTGAAPPANPDAAPVITSVQVVRTNSTATIGWQTDKASNSTVEYGTTTSLGSAAGQDDSVTSHTVQLTGLTNNTLYYYNITSCNSADNCSTTGPLNFTTLQTSVVGQATYFEDFCGGDDGWTRSSQSDANGCYIEGSNGATLISIALNTSSMTNWRLVFTTWHKGNNNMKFGLNNLNSATINNPQLLVENASSGGNPFVVKFVPGFPTLTSILPSDSNVTWNVTIDKTQATTLTYVTAGGTTYVDGDTRINLGALANDYFILQCGQIAAGGHCRLMNFTLIDLNASGSVPEPDPEPDPVCGNSAVEDGETCDDGNILPGDGCDGTCQLESCPNDFLSSTFRFICNTEGCFFEGTTCQDSRTGPGTKITCTTAGCS